MIVGTKFPGDDDEILKKVQHDCYWGYVSYLFECPKERYLRAAHFLGVETEISQDLKKVSTLDHRVLQATHDTLAAYFRFTHQHLRQLQVSDDAVDQQEALRAAWADFYRSEVEKLAEDDDLARAILKAVVYANTPLGREAEDKICGLLAIRYEGLEAARRKSRSGSTSGR